MFGLRLCLRILSFCGSWRSEKQPWFIWVLVSTTSFFISSTFLATQLGWLAGSRNLTDFNERMFLVPQFVNSFIKANLMVRQRKKVNRLSQLFRCGYCVPRNSDEVVILRRHERAIKLLSHASFCISNAFIMSTVLAPQTRAKRGLPCNAWLPYFLRSGTDVGYWVSYAHQVVAIVLLLNNTVAIIWVMLGFVHQLSGQFVVLRLRFSKLPKIAESAKSNGKLTEEIEKKFIRDSVRNHQYLLQLTKEVNDTFECFMIQQLCLITVVLSSNLYKLTVKSDDAVEIYVVTLYMICNAIHFSIFSWFCNQIMVESLNFGKSIQTIDWTSLSANTRKNLVLIMARASKLNVIRCGIFKFNLELSLKILKVSYAMWNFSRTITSR